MENVGKTATGGTLSAMLIRGSAPIEWRVHVPAPLTWKLRNWLRWDFIKGWLAHNAGRLASKTLNVAVMLPELRAKLIRRDGTVVDYGVISRRMITTAFCELMVDQLITETSVWGDFKYHDSGIGTTAAAITDTAIETTDGESRATGTQVEASSVAYQSVGTIAYTTTKAITEHGLFNTAANPTLIDRHVFAAINVINGDSIQYTYSLTCVAGG